jgi:FlaG/FlaF family flagellin (archaellin)
LSKIKINNEFKHLLNQIKKNTSVSVGIYCVNQNINKYHHDTIKSSYWDAMTKKIRSKQAVSEVIGVVLLLGITITLFAVLNFNVSQLIFGSSIPLVNLVGTIDKTQNMIYIEHNGGESLEGTTEIIINIGPNNYQKNASDLLIDRNLDSKWNFGETLQFNFTGYHIDNITKKYIGVTVIDSNAILLSVVLQQGSRS